MSRCPTRRGLPGAQAARDAASPGRASRARWPELQEVRVQLGPAHVRGCTRMREDPQGWQAVRRKIVRIRQDSLELFDFVNRRSPVQTGPAAPTSPEGSEPAQLLVYLPSAMHRADDVELRQVQRSIGCSARVLLDQGFAEPVRLRLRVGTCTIADRRQRAVRVSSRHRGCPAVPLPMRRRPSTTMC